MHGFIGWQVVEVVPLDRGWNGPAMVLATVVAIAVAVLVVFWTIRIEKSEMEAVASDGEVS